MTVEQLQAEYRKAVETRESAQRWEWRAELALMEAEGRGHVPHAAWLRGVLDNDEAAIEAARLEAERANLAKYGPSFFVNDIAKKHLGVRAVVEPAANGADHAP